MFSISLPSARLGRALVTIIAMAVAAACSDDKATAPQAHVPDAASAAVGGPARGCGPVCTDGKILYSAGDIEVKPPNGHIWVMNADTTGKTQLTFGTADDDWAAWSPNYKKVVFSSNRNGRWELFTVNVDGTGLKQLTSAPNPGGDTYASWSPDGSKIFFSRSTWHPTASAWHAQIFSVNANGTGLTKVASDSAAALYYPIVSPDGQKIVAVRHPFGTQWGDARLYTMNIDGTNLKMLTDGWLGDAEPAWSPDGTKLAFTCGNAYEYYRDICIVNADGTDRRGVVRWSGAQANPSFSPDGTRIIFESFASSSGTLHTVKLDGSGATQLTSFADPMAYYSAAWSR
jgi:TolB protein